MASPLGPSNTNNGFEASTPTGNRGRPNRVARKLNQIESGSHPGTLVESSTASPPMRLSKPGSP
jgi:hypothetical protein